MQVNILKKYIKKCLCLYICFSIVFITLFPAGTVLSAASKIKLSKTSLTIKAGKSKTIKLKKNGKKLKAKFSSSKPKIAKVNKKSGKITGKKKGKCTITAKYAGKKYKCKVKVTKKASKSKTNPSSESSNPDTDGSTDKKNPETSQNPEASQTPGSGQDTGYNPGGSSMGEEYPGIEEYPGGEEYPGMEEYPGGEEYPGYEEDPYGTYGPDTTRKPAASTNPHNTQRPRTTKRPYVTIVPYGTDEPGYEDPYGTYGPAGDSDFPYEEDPYGTYEPAGDTDFPYEEDPYGTYGPGITDGTGTTKSPYNTQKPLVSQKPDITQRPLVSQSPVNTKKPYTSQSPVNTRNPYASQNPVNTRNPYTSQNPYNTQSPFITQNPVASQPPYNPDYGDDSPGSGEPGYPWTDDGNTPGEEEPPNPDEPGYNDEGQDTGVKHYLTPYWTTGVNVYDNKGSSFNMGGKNYTQGICEMASANNGSTRDNYVIYNLGSKFSTVSFDVGCVDYESRSNVSISIESGGNIYPGGYPYDYEIEHLQVFCQGREVKRVTINTVGVNQLRIGIFGVYGTYGIGNVTGNGSHIFERLEVKEATARQNGKITYKCKYCEESYTETIPAQTECKPALVPYNTDCVRFINSDYNSGCFKVMGKEYCKGIIPDYTSKSVEWSLKLDKKCKSVTFSAGPLDNNFNTKTFYGLALYVYADRKCVKFNEDGKTSDYIMLGTFMLNKTFTINTEGVTELRFESGGGTDEQFAFFDITYETVTRNEHVFQNVNGREKCVNCGCYND